MQLHLTIDLRAVILGFVLLLVAAAVATPFAISLADDGPGGDRSSEQRAVLGTAFTYQGRLDVNGVPAEGAYDLRFTLHSDAIFIAPVGLPLLSGVDVKSGIFSVALNFGANAFDGTARWLAIEARQGATPFELMSPRQQLNATPYALFALSAGTAATAAAVDWGGVANKPFGFADGIDNDTRYTADPGGGLTLTGTVFNADQNVLQHRISGSCPANLSIRSVGADGSVVCEVDDVGAPYTAGAGLQLASNQFSIQFGGNGAAPTASRSDHTHPVDPAVSTFINRFGTVSAGNRGGCYTGGAYIGGIFLMVGNGPSSGSAIANGQLLPINTNQALFSLYGTTFGGNGTTNFALPDLRPIAPNGMSYAVCLQGIFPPAP